MMREDIYNMDYALGNSAKAMIIANIIDEVGADSVTIFDFGCGSGEQWEDVLEDYSNLKYVGYEPNTKRANSAKKRLPDRVSIYTDQVPDSTSADYVISFSVFEHVSDRESYIKSMENILDDGGKAYLNYDDGHFRNSLDLNNPRKWPQQIKAWIHSIVGPIFSVFDDPSRYQKRVETDELEKLITKSQLSIQDVYYNNISDMKRLASKIPAESKQEYVEHWVNIELTLNEMLRDVQGAEVDGDSCVLWDVALSKTLILQHGESPS